LRRATSRRTRSPAPASARTGRIPPWRRRCQDREPWRRPAHRTQAARSSTRLLPSTSGEDNVRRIARQVPAGGRLSHARPGPRRHRRRASRGRGNAAPARYSVGERGEAGLVLEILGETRRRHRRHLREKMGSEREHFSPEITTRRVF
jgi:hypothetical protein